MNSYLIIVLVSISCLFNVMTSAPIDNYGNETSDEDMQNTTNNFIDDVIDAFRDSLGKDMDPLKIPLQSFNFERNFILIKLHGEATLMNGTLYGLSKFKRTRDAYLGPHPEKGQMYTEVPLGVEDLNMTSLVRLNFLGAKMNSDLLVKIQRIEAVIKAYLSHDSGLPVIDAVHIKHMDGIRIDLPSLGILSTFFDLFSRAFLTIFKGSLKGMLEKSLIRVANHAIRRTNIKFS